MSRQIKNTTNPPTVRWPNTPDEWRLAELDDLLRSDHEPPLTPEEWEKLHGERGKLLEKLGIDPAFAWGARPWRADKTFDRPKGTP